MEFKTQFISREDRRIARQALTGRHGFKANVEHHGQLHEVSLSDFSSLGFAITASEDVAGSYKVGDSIEVKLSPLINHLYEIRGVIIDKQSARAGAIKLSAVIEHQQRCMHDEYQPIHLSPEQSLKGQFIHPFFYKQNSYFELESLSRNGFYATNINSDFTLFNGMELTFSLGSIRGLQDYKGRISNVSLTSDNAIRCFVETPSLPYSAIEDLSRHCFHFAQKTPREISLAGLQASHIQELVQYRFVETQAEYEAVLKLRRKAQASKGLCAKDEPIARFALQQDAYGRILIAFHNARVIGSALLVFGERGVKPFELDGLIPLSRFSELPAYEEIMEITAIYIERHYQDTDVWHGVFENMYREGLSAGKKHIMVASEPEQQARFERMGFSDSGLRFNHPQDKTIQMSVLVLDKDTGKTGKGMSPLLWWQVWGAVSLHLYKRRIIDYSRSQKVRVYLNRGLYHIVRSFKRLVSQS
ncbi:MAG: hypothetical protein R3183_10820 [Oleiphilaceae bacterium]|nr:hypothetical protein [Oleiphilaceae bacterium]